MLSPGQGGEGGGGGGGGGGKGKGGWSRKGPREICDIFQYGEKRGYSRNEKEGFRGRG